jgi:hypothetical protein
MNRFARFAVAVLVVGGLGGMLAAETPKPRLASGRVSAVSNDSLAIAQGSATLTFAVDHETKLIGKGMSTMSREKEKTKEKMTLTDGVAVGDIVKVSYHDMDGKLHAAQVTVLQKSAVKK